MNWTVPTIAGIQRMTGILAALATVILAVAVSPTAALSCAAGAALMIANLFLLTIVGRAAQPGTSIIRSPRNLTLFCLDAVGFRLN